MEVNFNGKNYEVLDRQAKMTKFWTKQQEDFDFIGFRLSSLYYTNLSSLWQGR